ncbi:telomeric repeat-binding factor 2-like [Anolis carolinensis]|uniref:telomeric repeat-binding factor 2-like n=1 Tax=Anolis carolinensis TaxID=28377 RepID=UPI002F2B8508
MAEGRSAGGMSVATAVGAGERPSSSSLLLLHGGAPQEEGDPGFRPPERKGKKRKEDPTEDLTPPTTPPHKYFTRRWSRLWLCGCPETPTEASEEGPGRREGTRETSTDAALPGLISLPISPQETQAGAAQAVTQRPASDGAKRQRKEEEEEEEEEEGAPGLREAPPGTLPPSRPGQRPVTLSTFLMGKENPTATDATDKRMAAQQQLASVALPAEEDRQQQKGPPGEDARPPPRSNEEEGEKEVRREEEQLSVDSGPKGGSSANGNASGTSKKKKWTNEESQWIREGVKKFGKGKCKWKAIFLSYPFTDRSPVKIKDRWRTMRKLGID